MITDIEAWTINTFDFILVIFHQLTQVHHQISQQRWSGFLKTEKIFPICYYNPLLFLHKKRNLNGGENQVSQLPLHSSAQSFVK